MVVIGMVVTTIIFFITRVVKDFADCEVEAEGYFSITPGLEKDGGQALT